MGEFAHEVFVGTSSPYRIPTSPTKHSHGNETACHIRCGVNEGLAVRNDNRNVASLYTDSLLGCTQVILRNATATFTCHIAASASDPIGWMRWAVSQFRRQYGFVTWCAIISGDDPAIGRSLHRTICSMFRLREDGIVRKLGCGGISIDPASGDWRETPSTRNVSQANVGGWITCREMIDLRLCGPRKLGDAAYGDYFEGCGLCRSHF